MPITDRTGGLRHWTPRVAPAITTTTVLAAARAWNTAGAEHAISTVFLMGAFSAGSAWLGMSSASGVNGDPGITALGFGAAGTFAMAGVAAYTDGWELPVLLWLIATIAVYAFAVKYWREDMRAELGHLRALERDREKYRHVERVELTRARSARDVAELTHDATYAAQIVAARQHRQMLADHPELAGFGIAAEILLGDGAKEASEL